MCVCVSWLFFQSKTPWCAVIISDHVTVKTQPTSRRTHGAGAGAGRKTYCAVLALDPPDGCWYQAHISQTNKGYMASSKYTVLFICNLSANWKEHSWNSIAILNVFKLQKISTACSLRRINVCLRAEFHLIQ